MTALIESIAIKLHLEQTYQIEMGLVVDLMSQLDWLEGRTACVAAKQ